VIREEWRSILHHPFSYLGRLCVVAAGTAVAAAAYVVLSAAVLQPLPYPEANRIFAVWDSADGERRLLSHAVVRRLIAAGAPVEAAASYATADFSATVDDRGAAATFEGAVVSSGLLPMLGARPTAGVVFRPSDFEPGAEAVIVVSERLRVLYPDLRVGSSLPLNGVPHRVVGILDGNFGFPTRDALVWVPLQLPAASGWSGHAAVRLTSAADSAGVLAAMLGGSGIGMTLETASLREILLGPVRTHVWSLQFAAGALLIVAMVAAAYGFFADAWERRPLYALRGALGASGARLVAHYACGVGIFSVMAASLAVAILAGIMTGVFDEWSRYLPRTTSAMAWPGVAACLVLSFVGSTIASLPGLLTVVRVGTAGNLRGVLHVPRSPSAYRAVMVVEAALVFGLCVTAVWCALALRGLLGANVGFGGGDFMFARLSMPAATASNVRVFAGRLAQLQDALERSGIPAGATSILPLSKRDHLVSVRFFQGGRLDRDYSMVRIRVVTRRFFEVAGVRCLAGACLDHGVALPVTVNDAFRRKFLADETVLGAPIHFGGRQWTITGVLASVAHETLVEEPAPEVFVDYVDIGAMNATTAAAVAKQVFLAFDSGADGQADVARARAIVREVFPESQLETPTMFSDAVRAAATYRPLLVACAALFAAVAAVILVANAHSLIARELGYRRREFAVRQAVGGTPSTIVRRHFARDAVFVAAGCVLGTALAWWAVQALRARLFVPAALSVPHPVLVGIAASVCCGVLLSILMAWHAQQLRASDLARLLRTSQ
jgi:hypothetical protein